MTDENTKEPGNTPGEGGNSRLSAVVGELLTSTAALSAEGVGPLFEATRGFIDGQLKPDLVEVTDPDTGVTVLATIDRDGIMPLHEGFFANATDNPRFRRGTASLTRIESFIAHVNRFGDEDTVVFADDRREAPKLTAVLDYHRADRNVSASEGGVETDDWRELGEFRHGLHRATFAFPLSPEWNAWVKADGKVMTMADFALFLEDRIGDIAIAGDDWPEHLSRFVEQNGGADRIADYASLIELSRGLKVYEQAQVEEAINLTSGEGQIRFSVEHDTRNRSGGTVRVPTMFFISIPIFAKGAFYRIAARLRYRKTAEGVKFWFNLWRPDLSFDHAFAEAVDRVDSETAGSVLFGAPEA